MVTLGELRPGTLFRTEDGRLWQAGRRGVKGRPCLPLGPEEFEDDTDVIVACSHDVEPLDLPALLAERDELLALTHDLLIDSAAYERGRQAERGEVVRLLEAGAMKESVEAERARRGGDDAPARGFHIFAAGALRWAVDAVRARGPAATPLPPARLAERVKVLETALRGLADAAGKVSGPYQSWMPDLIAARAAARAALEGAGGKQPT